MNILITICARGGSKGIPGKNIKEINGKPLLAYTIDIAHKFQREFPHVDIALSTDSVEIKDVARRFGLSSDYVRPENLSGDRAGKIGAIEDILLYSEQQNSLRYDYILDMDVTSPLRNMDDLMNAYKAISSDQGAVNLFSVSPAGRNPYFNMVEQKENGYYGTIKESNSLSRQAAPKVYDMNASFYYYKRRFFDEGYDRATTDRSLIYEVPHICFDLDEPLDFEVMSYLLANNKLDFEL